VVVGGVGVGGGGRRWEEMGGGDHKYYLIK
jgi:hypothetical protein